MKKILGIIFTTVLLYAGSAFGAASVISVTNDQLIRNISEHEDTFRVLTISFTASSVDGTISSLTLNDQTSGLLHGDIKGWYLYQAIVSCNTGGTEVTEDSDMYVYEQGVDMLAGNGVDQVDNTANRAVHFQIGSTPCKIPVISDLTLTITQAAAATNSAAGVIRIILTK